MLEKVDEKKLSYHPPVVIWSEKQVQ